MVHLTYWVAFFFLILLPVQSWAHGFAGKRFFPTTFQVDDPFISDEFSILLNHINQPDAKTTEVGVDVSKLITPHFGLTVADSFRHQDFPAGGSADGFGNVELGAKWQFLTNEARETILSVGTTIEVGGTGTRKVGADSFSTISPAVFFGKGIGNLPDAVKYLKPFAITGVVGPNIPTRRTNVTVDPDTGETAIDSNPTTLTWALSLQYSLMYLQSYVKDIGLSAPFNRMIAVVEFPMQTCLSSECDGQTTGTVNPGIVWAGKYVELGVAAQIPMNSRSGNNVGVFALFHLFIDNLFPKTIGRPIFP